MKELEIVIKNKCGLHARPAGKLSQLCRSFESEITVKSGSEIADGKRLLSLMALGAKCGSTLSFQIDGKDEDAAVASIKELCEGEL